jgi:hypothetical protein
VTVLSPPRSFCTLFNARAMQSSMSTFQVKVWGNLFRVRVSAGVESIDNCVIRGPVWSAPQ